MAIAASYVSGTSFTVSGDRAAEFAVGVRVRADCGADGTILGTVTAAGYADPSTTVTMAPDSGALTANLTGVEHGNDVPASLCGHAAQHAPGGRDPVPPAVPGLFGRDVRFAAKAVSVAADRYTLLSPGRMAVDVNGTILTLAGQQALDLSASATWDGASPDYTVAANRAGKDFSVHACNDSGALKLLVSANATYPTGYSASTSRRIAGFHCLCAAVGTISGHPLTGYAAGDILPASVWDLKHRPACDPGGMTFVAGIGRWVDIYLASVSGGVLVSANGGTIADGTSSPAFHWYKFSQWFGAVGKRLLTQHEFVAASLGANQGTNITGSADPGTTGGHTDTAGRRMISNVGCEDCCGVLFQWGAEPGGGASSAAWASACDANDGGVAGQQYLAPNRAIWGGRYDGGTLCGSRASGWHMTPLSLNSGIAARGVADHVGEA